MFESRNVLFTEPDNSWPIVWERARGVRVRDADGKIYLDLTAAFGVAAAGHANAAVVRAGRRQMGTLLHAMGDVHPHEPKARLAQALSGITFERWASGIQNEKLKLRNRGKTIFCNSGFEAVEAALKTAMLATGKNELIAFEGAYHGLGYGALNVTHREHFRSPFRRQLREFAHFLPFPNVSARISDGTKNIERQIEQLFRQNKIGAILVEPIQVRGGIRIPPPEFLPMLRRLCDDHGALLIFDEIYTGFGRTGKWFACEQTRVLPDVICLGKALTGGFPLSACVGRAEIMDAWPPSRGEAIHTSTFLGHPVGCAMALANMAEIKKRRLVERSAHLGKWLLQELRTKLRHSKSDLLMEIRGQGLLAGIELRRSDGSPATDECLRLIKSMLRRGFILLPEGGHGNVISWTPPLVISQAQLATAADALAEILNEPRS